MAITTGTVLKERYRVERTLGQGGMATVYLAKDTHLDDAPVVVKVPKRFLLEEETGGSTGENRERFAREIKQLIKVRGHDGIVRILDQGVIDDLPYYVLEHQGGGSLADRLRRGPQDPQAVLAWLRPVAAALDDIAHLGLVHRDVKPDNILFAEAPEAGGIEPRRARLSDFGIVKALGDQLLGRTGNTYIGTLEYMSPEQADPRATLTGACDQYALAATVYEALAGRIPHHGTPRLELPGVRRARVPARLGTDGLAAHVPEAVASAVARGLAISAADRFPSCVDFVTAFAAGLTPRTEARGTVRVVLGPAAPAPEPARSSARRRVLVAVPLALAAGIGAFAWANRGGPSGGGGERAAREPGLSPPAAVRRTLRLDSPLPTALRGSALQVKGSADGDLPPGALLTLQDRDRPDSLVIPVQGRTFAVEWALPESDGSAEAVLRCTAPGLECQPLHLGVLVDRTPPRWSDEARVWEPLETAEDTVTFTARLEDRQPVTVRFGESVGATTSGGEGAWTFKTVLPVPRQGEVSVAFEAEDALGNRAEPRALVVRRKTGTEPWAVELAAAGSALGESRWTDFGARLAEARTKGLPPARLDARLQEAERLLAGAVRLPLRAVDSEGWTQAKDDPLDVMLSAAKEDAVLRWRGNLNGEAYTLLVLDAAADGKFASPKDGWWLGTVGTPMGQWSEVTHVMSTLLSRPDDPFFERPASKSVPWRLLEIVASQALVARDANAGTLAEYLERRWRRSNAEKWFPRFAKRKDIAAPPWDLAKVENPAWIFAVDAASVFARARSLHKPVFIDVGAEWCPPCRQLDYDTYPDAGVRAALANFLCVRLDLDWLSRDVFGALGGGRDGIPLLGFYDWTGRSLTVAGKDSKGQPADVGVAAGFVKPEELAQRAQQAWEAWQAMDRDGWPIPAWAAGLSTEQKAEAKKLRVPVAFENDLGMRFVLIPAGTFDMGSPPQEADRADHETLHRVTLTRSYYLQTTEVTNEQFRAWQAKHTVEPVSWNRLSHLSPPDPRFVEGPKFSLDGATQPVVMVSHADATGFAAWLTERRGPERYRLPSEAEWERACRAGTGGAWWWGTDASKVGRFANVADRAWHKGTFDFDTESFVKYGFDVDDGHVVAAPVGSLAASPWGMFDMLGNVWEWCADWAYKLPSSDQQDPVVLEPLPGAPISESVNGANTSTVPARGAEADPARVIRGGSWMQFHSAIRAAARASFTPESRYEVIGFRLLVEVR